MNENENPEPKDANALRIREARNTLYLWAQGSAPMPLHQVEELIERLDAALQEREL
jgi:hypothetical protein